MTDRRSFDRFTCPGTTVFIYKNYWYQNLRFRIFKNIVMYTQEILQIQNMSRNGILILGKNALKRGDGLYLLISAPGKQRIMIKGTVCWKETNTLDVEKIGIQFLAFSNWKKYNSLEIQKQLYLLLSRNHSSIVEYNEGNDSEILK